MSREYYYDLCSRSVGEAISIETTDGETLQGLAVKVDENHLYVCPLSLLDGDKANLVKLLASDRHLIAIPLAAILSFEFIQLLF
jgi:hypothetical protein